MTTVYRILEEYTFWPNQIPETRIYAQIRYNLFWWRYLKEVDENVVVVKAAGKQVFPMVEKATEVMKRHAQKNNIEWINVIYKRVRSTEKTYKV